MQLLLIAVLILVGGFRTMSAGGVAPLRLVRTIALPGVEGRIDHFSVDVAGKRLFVCALGNNTVEVIDLRKGEHVHSLTGLGSPQGAAYLTESSRLVVSNERGGICNVYDGKSYVSLVTINLTEDADNVRYDCASKKVYVGYGSGLAVVDPETSKVVTTVALSGHPEAFELEKRGPRIFVNVPGAHHVAVIDRTQTKVVARWETGEVSGNFPMGFDDTHHRLFIGCRSPSRLVVLNSDSGEVVATLPIPGDSDDVFYDEKRLRLFVVCGEGSIAVIDQVDADTYKTSATMATASGARTGLFVPELQSLFVAVPDHGSQNAEVRCYAVE